jgi:hypothetical protein
LPLPTAHFINHPFLVLPYLHIVCHSGLDPESSMFSVRLRRTAFAGVTIYFDLFMPLFYKFSELQTLYSKLFIPHSAFPFRIQTAPNSLLRTTWPSPPVRSGRRKPLILLTPSP